MVDSYYEGGRRVIHDGVPCKVFSRAPSRKTSELKARLALVLAGEIDWSPMESLPGFSYVPPDKPEGKAAIDSQVIGNLAQIKKLEVVLVTGHTDRLGTDAHNQKLSVQRADAVRDYLVFKGVDKAKIETIGMGEKQPVVQCDQKNVKQLIDCLQPNRRVDVQAKGEAMK